MTSLRTRLAMLLVAAIVGVVLVAAFVTFKISDRPRFTRLEQSFADEVVIVSRLLDGSAARARAAGIRVGPPPSGDTAAFAEQSAAIAALAKTEAAARTRIVTGENGLSEIAIPITETEWAYLTYPGKPPSPIAPLMSYLSIVILGAVCVSLYAAARITGPMRVLEEAVLAVRPDGSLEPIAETGPAEVRATAKVLNALSTRLKHATESRMRLVAAAGHDLRTPMTRMRLRAEFLPEADRATWLRDLEELDLIADSAIRLVREEVTDGAVETISLGRLAGQIVGELTEIGAKAELRSVADVEISMQPMAMKRALRNLIENAALHGDGAFVTVALETGAAVLLVEDEGPGIPPDLLGRVFEPFFRVDPARRKAHPGAGLGLAIAREIIERNGGTLAIRNRAEGGLSQRAVFPAMGETV